MKGKRWQKALLQAGKLAVGSSAAICLAELFQLQFAASAGSIALLTIVATKWETVRLSLLRIVTFALASAMIWLTITMFHSEWVAYGVFIFLLVILCEWLGWKSTVSVNAVIGTHFLSAQDIGWAFIRNELYLVLLGISIALVLNLFHNNSSHKKQIEDHISYTEEQLKSLFGKLADYLLEKPVTGDVWEEIKDLEHRLTGFGAEAHDYQNNTFVSHPQYYIDYFEMRLKQCTILHNLHYEMKKIKTMPEQAKIIADYVQYLAGFVVEHNVPRPQIERLEELFADMKKEPLPLTREEFESRAILYHILMDLEDFLYIKKRFVEGVDEIQRKIYWGYRKI